MFKELSYFAKEAGYRGEETGGFADELVKHLDHHRSHNYRQTRRGNCFNFLYNINKMIIRYDVVSTFASFAADNLSVFS